MLDRTSTPPNRTEATEASYRNTVDDLRHMAEREARAGGDLFEVVGWFCSKHDCWSSSTIRQYRAALSYTIATTVQLHPDHCEGLLVRLRRGPDARYCGPPRTAARKRRSLPYHEWTLLMQTVRNSSSPDGRLVLCFLIFGPALFLRPSEYLAARVEGNILVVRNAKATNGRANGEERSRNLDMPATAIDELATFLTLLAEAAQTAGSHEKLFDRLSARLGRVCKRCGVRRVSLYTLRHLGIATAKAWMTSAEVAAAAGHASTRTASTHYAKRRHGWGDVRLAGLPTAASIQAVRQVGNPRFDQRLPTKAALPLPR
jgi:integrase